MTFWDFADRNFFYMIFVGLPIFSIIVAVCIWITIYIFSKYGMILSIKGIELKKEHDKQEEKEKKIKIHEYAIRDVLVYGELGQLGAYFSADIIAVFQLHNGGHYNNGISVQKFTLSHDFATTGNASFYMKSVKFKDQLISQAKDWIGETIIKGYMFLNVSEMDEESTWRRELVRNGIQYAILKLVESDDVPEFILGVFFRRHFDSIELDYNNSILREYADKISSILKDGEIVV